jgi:CheY-like chemotaxis protein
MPHPSRLLGIALNARISVVYFCNCAVGVKRQKNVKFGCCRKLACTLVRLRTIVAANYSPMDAAQPQNRLRIVVVDDNYDANASLSRLLERSGFEVTGRAYDGLSGLDAIKTTHPDVAILDIAMPALDGFGLASRIRREMQTPPRLIALTGFNKALKSDAINAGFDAFFCKPADWNALRAELDNCSHQ